MRIAILANGPSLLDHYDVRNDFDYDLVVGVNSAGWKIACDWVAYFDAHIYRDWPDREHFLPDMVITHAKMQTWTGVERMVPGIYNKRMPKDLAMAYAGEGLTCNWTFPSTIDAVTSRHPDAEIDFYGFDVAVGQTDIAGLKGSRTPKRWLRELPWVREQWQPHWNVYSTIDPDILAWIRGEGEPKDLTNVLRIPEYIANGGQLKEVRYARGQEQFIVN
jgi:hypothetical protein